MSYKIYCNFAAHQKESPRLSCSHQQVENYNELDNTYCRRTM